MSSVTPNLPYQALYRACMKEAAAQGRMLMQRLVRRAARPCRCARRAYGDEDERKLLTDAARTLMKHEGALCEAYPQALLANSRRRSRATPARRARSASIRWN